jgi:hypothetical protein
LGFGESVGIGDGGDQGTQNPISEIKSRHIIC